MGFRNLPEAGKWTPVGSAKPNEAATLPVLLQGNERWIQETHGTLTSQTA